jgi:hypothetical protein
METTALRPYIHEARIVVTPDPDPDTSYLDQDEFSAELAAYQAGEFGYVGVYAEADLRLATPQGGWIHAGTIRSGGLWGIEDHSGDDYLREVGADELDELKTMLAALNVAESDIAVIDAPLTYC